VVGYGWNELRNASLSAKLFYGSCALLAITIWGMSWWIAPRVSAGAPSPAPSPNPPQLLSRMDRFIFACDVPPPDAETAAQLPQKKEQFKQTWDVLGDAIGMSVDVTDIRGGVRMIFDATTPEARRRLITSYVSKLTIEVRRVGEIEIVTASVDLPEIVRFLSFMAPVQPQDTANSQSKIEKLIGAPEGGCHLL
jgi:hypothetical protein